MKHQQEEVLIQARAKAPVAVAINGTDLAKALILGADAALVGRPVLWGLATAGAAGVEAVIGIIEDEFDRALALLGVPRAAALKGQTDLPFDRK